MSGELDPYLYPGTNVLQNKPGIRDNSKLSEFEYEATAVRAAQLRDNPITGNFDLDHFKAIHAHLFSDVYEWAGQIRSVNISKGGTSFAGADFIAAEAKRLGASLAKENNLRGLEKPQFVERLAYYYGEWNALHPHREGNGRTTRELIGQLAREAGYEFDQTRIDNSKGQWVEAAVSSFHGDLEPVRRIFLEAIRPSRAVAFDKLPEAEALAKHPELKGAFEGLRAVRHLLAERFPDNAQTHDQYITQVKMKIVHELDAGKILEPPDKTQHQAPQVEPASRGIDR